MVFLPFWMLLTFAGLSGAILIFAWAIRTGQFTEQKRMAAQPLRDLSPEERARPPRRFSFEVAALIAIFLGGIGLIVVALVLSSGVD